MFGALSAYTYPYHKSYVLFSCEKFTNSTTKVQRLFKYEKDLKYRNKYFSEAISKSKNLWCLFFQKHYDIGFFKLSNRKKNFLF